MRASLPRRLFLAMLLALGIIVFTPTPLLADAALPWVAGIGPLMVGGLVPIILIEGMMLRRRMRLKWSRAYGASTAANVVSTVVGMLAVGFLMPGNMPYHQSGAKLFLPLMVLLVPLYFVSWGAEYPVVRWIVGPDRPGAAAPSSKAAPAISAASWTTRVRRPPLWQGVLEANGASYVFLALVVGGFWVADVLHPRPPWIAQASAVGSLRTINTAEITYASTYGRGFSPSLAVLAPGNDANLPTDSAAGLIDSVLASGVKNGYTFTYIPGPPDLDGKIQSYTVTASPLRPEWGHYYYTDQSGVIRYNPTAPASAADSPLAG